MHNCFVVVADMGDMVPDVDGPQAPPRASHSSSRMAQAEQEISNMQVFGEGMPDGLQPFVLSGAFFAPPPEMGMLSSSAIAPSAQRGTIPATSTAQFQPPPSIFSSLGPSLLFRMGGGATPAGSSTSSNTTGNARSSGGPPYVRVTPFRLALVRACRKLTWCCARDVLLGRASRRDSGRGCRMHRSLHRAVPKQPGASATGKTPSLFFSVHFTG